MGCGGGGGAWGRDERTHPPCSVHLKSRFFRFFCSILRSNFYGTPFNSNTVVVSRTKFELR